MKRFNPNINSGLSSDLVKYQIENNNVNIDTTVPTRSYKTIILTNIFTLFNTLNFIFAVIIFFTGSYKNLLFLGTAFWNTLISIIQEIRAKREVDSLRLLCEPKVTVVRDSKEVTIGINEIVLDDIIKFKLGNQVIVDSIILEGEVSVNEAFITGESEPKIYKKGDMLLSGSFIVSGSCTAKVEHIKEDNYSSKISKEAKYLKKVNSILLSSLNKIIKILSIVIIPLGILLFCNQYFSLHNPLNNALINTIAALIAMIPEGLVLLTSTVLAVSVIRLSKDKVLVKQLYCIETLARVDTICFDKTGTLTLGNMKVKDIVILNKRYSLNNIMTDICGNLNNDNATMEALKEYFKSDTYNKASKIIPFSSDKKYSGIEIKGNTYLLGAPEFVSDSSIDLTKYEEYRVLMLVKKDTKNIPLGLILLEDSFRPAAKKTIDYFINQGVNVKIISGDNPKTVKNIVNRLGLNIDKYVDCSKLSDEELRSCVDNTNIFGRVTPFQKKIIVKELQKLGHTVAMVGDGVNDVLALKQSDCSIALASGSTAAYNVSDLVLLNSDFTSIPNIVKEGRRTINNIEKSASLFIVKTGYAVMLTFIFMIIPFNYPFIPIQLTLTSSLTIGIPSFLLALEPNNDKVSGNFLTNVFKKALPTSCIIVIHILVITLLPIPSDQKTTLSLIMVGFIGFTHIYRICKPLKPFNLIMLIVLIAIFVFGIVGLNELFSLTIINLRMLLIIVLLIINSLVEFKIVDTTNEYLKTKNNRKKD